MKKQLFTFYVLLLSGVIANAQTHTLWGMTPTGGHNNDGVIFKMNLDGSGYTIAHYFNYSTGYAPSGNLIKASDNKLYGMTNYGGIINDGVLFRIDPLTNAYSILYHFNRNNNNGTRPKGSLFQANDGKLYGMTSEGGSFSAGVLFSLNISNPLNPIYTKLKDFNGFNGLYPIGNLIQASDGKLYGMTKLGGSNNKGNLFSFDPSNPDPNLAFRYWDFGSSAVDAAYPFGSLIQNGSDLYGTSNGGGRCNKGTVFNFNMTTHLFHYPMEFCGTQPDYGSYILGSLIKTPGKTPVITEFYGMTFGENAAGSSGVGNIFNFSNLTPFASYPVTFDGVNKGAKPTGSLMKASDGKFYGMTRNGGSGNYGVAFRFDPSNNNSIIKIHTFLGGWDEGSYPAGDLLEFICPAPATPGTISGIASACPGMITFYATASVPGATSYTWSVPPGSVIQGPSNGGAIQVRFGTHSGNITVKASGICGISGTRTKAITIDLNCLAAPPALKAEEANAAAYPNPSSGNIIVKFNSINSSKYIIHVADMTGRILLSDESQAREGINLHQLDLSKLAKGMYSIELAGNNKKEFLKVMVR